MTRTRLLMCVAAVAAGLPAVAADPPADRPVENELTAYKRKFTETAPPDVTRVFEAGIDQVRRSGVVEKAVKVGDKAPDFALPTADGKTVRLSDKLKDGPVVLVWYRGGWCPYCNIQLRGFQNVLPELKAAGASVIAVAPETPDHSADTAGNGKLDFPVASDKGNEAAQAYGVAYKLPADVADKFRGRIDLAKYNGDDSLKLPLAATYVVGTDGVVKWAFVDADYRNRAEPADVLAAVRRLAR